MEFFVYDIDHRKSLVRYYEYGNFANDYRIFHIQLSVKLTSYAVHIMISQMTAVRSMLLHILRDMTIGKAFLCTNIEELTVLLNVFHIKTKVQMNILKNIKWSLFVIHVTCLNESV